ncbi:hypothetical protein Fmac_020890 [Flemingia macrophylla]|uniref:Uncharacterized protein n=1 Tax=Flemingia macrophylla TaxID=520843 RepID=A0ABD1LVA7_9FABA
MTTMTAFKHHTRARQRTSLPYCYRCYFFRPPPPSMATPMSPLPITPTPFSSMAARKPYLPNPSSGRKLHPQRGHNPKEQQPPRFPQTHQNLLPRYR